MYYKNSYRNKKVFITGHTGFKGSWLLTWLHLLGARIKGYSLPPLPEHKLYWQINGNSLCESVFDDILHYEELEKSIVDFAPDFIFHLAAQPLVRRSYQYPLETFGINAMGTANLLNAVRKLKNSCIVILITTDKVYFNYEWTYAYRETDRLGGYDPYSASKACAELIIDSFRKSYFNIDDYKQHQKSLAVARAGNVIGGGDWATDRIIPDIIRGLQSGNCIAIRNPNSIRPWQHVMESINAYLLLGSKLMEDPLAYASEYNFGPLTNDCWEVERMVKYAIELWGNGNYQLENCGLPSHESGILKLDISKAQKELWWSPLFRADEAIQKTISWYKRFDETNAYELILEDIYMFSEMDLR